MTKKDFEFIVHVILNLDPLYRRSVAVAFAARLALENPRFDRARFLQACGEDW